MPILRVALDLPLDRLFDYLDNGSMPPIGSRVLVPFGPRQLMGVVMAHAETSDFAEDKLKTLLQSYPEEPLIPAETLRLFKFCADYYHTALGQAVVPALPSRLRDARPAPIAARQYFQLSALAIAQGLESIPKRAASQRKLYLAFSQHCRLQAEQLRQMTSQWRVIAKHWMEQGWLEIIEDTSPAELVEMAHVVEFPRLNPPQQAAVDAILKAESGFRVWLLHGITGSGKTEVYMQLLQAMMISPQAQALVLVPEINLTPQLEARFRSRFPQWPMVMLHSQMNESERLLGWRMAQSCEARIVIGTRLSVFTPMADLRVIVVDEEHDSSYKQQDGMRYSARDVAVMRGKMANVPVVLGSATPALETWYNAISGRYDLLTLDARAVAEAKLPNIGVIDTRADKLELGISNALKLAITDRLTRGEQSLLFINRRGYAPVLHCSACAWVAPCARCSSRLVVHLRQKRLRCHHCGHTQKMPLQCPSCGNVDLHPTGQGTQRLEDTLNEIFPSARILRVDRDSMRNRNALKKMAEQVHANEVDILVGTQMLAKGHDFPNLTLVGVIEADQALFSPDFRAAEKLFAQLMQVAGRAGRAAKAGEVLIQTNFPDHELFHALKRQDYAEFANAQLQERKMAHFPPYCHEVLVRAEASQFNLVMDFLNQAERMARAIGEDVIIYSPMRPTLERLNGMERGQLLIQADQRSSLQVFLRSWVPMLRAMDIAAKVRWSVDVDPTES